MIAPNTLLQNRYLVLHQIGQGGMGSVYIATDQRFGSTVALKETAFFNELNMRKAFEREARLLNHLRHPALPRVSDHFTEGDGQFLVMEYIAGDDLAEKLKERGGAFPLNEVLNWADQLLDALDYLHTQEPPVIHRDIKPQNLKLTPRNHIVLLDFGLAKGTPAMQTKVTATGSVFGYSRYYAPLEQIQAAGTDPRSDIYSLGATLYHLITGSIPPDALTRATAVLNGHPDPLRPANEVHEQVTPAVAEVINNAMAQNASQRPQTASAMREALREAARQGHSVARETNAQPLSPTNVYEQETKLIFAAASPATATAEAANKTGAFKAEGATVKEAATSTGAASSSTNAAESIVTKVAARQPKNSQRKRALGIAASAAVASALAAGVYTYTRHNTPTQTPASNESVQSASPTPQTSNTDNHNGQQPVESVVIIKKGTPETSGASTPTTKHPNAPPVKIIKENPPPVPREENAPPLDETRLPQPPDDNPNPMGDPRRPPLRRPRPGDPNFEEAMRIADERRRAADEARRAAQEQRRLQLLKQRMILENARRRRKQMQQP